MSGFDPVNSGWIAMLPAVGLVALFAGLAWLISRFAPVGAVPVASLPDDLGRIAVPVGAAVIAMLLPVYVFLFGFQIVVGLNPSAAPGGFDPSPLVDQLVDGFRVVLGLLLIGLALWQARRGRGGPALVLGGAGLMLAALGVRLLTGYRCVGALARSRRLRLGGDRRRPGDRALAARAAGPVPWIVRSGWPPCSPWPCCCRSAR